MRVLIISALFACAAGAPYTIVSPLVYQTQVIPAVVPTISPGDIHAAVVNTQVQVNDLATKVADQAQDVNDQVVANADAASQANDLTKERSEEAFWSNEDQKWQAVDALKTVEAEIDGAVASNADVYAKAAIGGVVPYVAPAPVVTSVLTPSVTPLVYTPYVAAINGVQTTEVKPEEKKEEAAVKSAEPEKPVAAEKVEVATEKPIVLANTIVTPYSNIYGWGSPVFGNYLPQTPISYASVPQLLTPSYLNLW